MIVRINGRALAIPRSAYGDLYDLGFVCPASCLAEPQADCTEAYESIDGRYLYIVMSGGVGTYMVRWVFDHRRYITRMVTDDEEITEAQFDGIADDYWEEAHPR